MKKEEEQEQRRRRIPSKLGYQGTAATGEQTKKKT